MKRCTWKSLCLLGLLLWLPCAAFAADPNTAPAVAPAPAPAAVAEEADDAADLRDPEAMAELKRASDFLTALPRFHIKASVVYDVLQEDDRLLQFEKHGDIYLQRPDRFFADVFLDDGRHRQFWYDGKMLSLAELSKNLHTRFKAPATIDGTLDLLEGLFKDPMPVADLFYSDLNPVAERAFEADIVGDSQVNGRPCKQLAFRGETVDWQIWVEQGPKPFIRKLVISYRELPGTPQSVALLDLWETPEKFNEEMFTFAVPAGSQWIDLLVPMPRTAEKGGQP